MSRVVVTRVVPASASVVWEVFADVVARASWLSEVANSEIVTAAGGFGVGTRWWETRVRGNGELVTEELVVTAADPPRSCTIALAGVDNHQLSYLFAPIEVGPQRGATAVSAVAESRPHGLANRLLGFFLAGFAARTVEGALRVELDALAAACRARVGAGAHPEAAA